MWVAEATSPEAQAKRLKLFEKVRKVKTIETCSWFRGVEGNGVLLVHLRRVPSVNLAY